MELEVVFPVHSGSKLLYFQVTLVVVLMLENT
jgi:hypothetical protein